MLVSQVSELEDGGFLASVSGTSPVPIQVVVASPRILSEKDEDCLRWYCEVSDSEPLVDVTQLRQVEAHFREYGQDLFDKVFGSPGTALPTDCKVTIRIVGSSPFCGMHWELLRDPVRGPVALDAARFIVRDVEKQPILQYGLSSGAGPNSSGSDLSSYSTSDPHPIFKYPTFNIIFVTARKREDLTDIPLRVESLAIIDRMRELKRPFRFDMVRPGSISALNAMLEQHEPGFYHVLHFDCHGTNGTGFDDSTPNSLLLENERSGFEPVSASKVAHIVDKFEIPIVFISACRSSFGKSSFAHDLLSQSSVQFVVAMALSVLFDTTARFAAEFYAAMVPLSGKATIREAAQRARRSMEKHRQRLGVLNSVIDREDWWIPVLYDRSGSALSGSSHFELCSWDVLLANAQIAQNSYNDRPKYEVRARKLVEEYRELTGFLGRENDLLKLECKLLSHERTDNILLLSGLIGIGKTTFLDYTSWWWHVTGVVHDSFVFRMNVRPTSVADIARTVLARLYPEQNCHSDEEVRDFVTGILKKTRYLIVIDGVENLRNDNHGNQNAETVSIHEESREKLLQFQEDIAIWLGQLHGGETVVLVGSRGQEPELFRYIKGNSFGLDLGTTCGGIPSQELRRLDDKASIALATQVLGIEDEPKSPYHSLLKDRTVMERMGGNPLLIKVFFGSLVGSGSAAIPSPDQLCNELQKVFIDFEKGASEGALLKSVQFSYNRISAAEQKALLFLMPFKETVSKLGLEKYSYALKRNRTPGFDLNAWQSAISMAVKWGLLTRHERLQHGHHQAWRMQACLSAFLIQEDHRAENLAAKSGEALPPAGHQCPRKRHMQVMYEAYAGWAGELNKAVQSRDGSINHEGILLVDVEYGNMEGVLDYALTNKLPFYSVLLLMYLTLDKVARRDLCQKAVDKLGTYRRFPEMSQKTSEEFRLDIARTYHIYGVALGNNLMFDKATEYLTYANSMWQSLRWTEEQAATIQELGWLAMCQERCSVAENFFHQALGISRGMNEILARHNLGQLALLQESIKTVKQERREKLAEAETSFTAALFASRNMGNRPAEAFSLHHLAIVAVRKGDLEAAETHAKQSLSIRDELGDGNGSNDGYANCLHLLANIAHKRAAVAKDPKDKIVYVSASRSLFNKAFLQYNKYTASRERDMLCENYGLLLATWGTCVATEAERETLRKTEMHIYKLIKHGPFPKALFNLGHCLEESGNDSGAFQAYCSAAEKRVGFIKDAQDHKARHMARMAKARCIYNGIGVAANQRKAVDIVLESRGSISYTEVFDEGFVRDSIESEWDFGVVE